MKKRGILLLLVLQLEAFHGLTSKRTESDTHAVVYCYPKVCMRELAPLHTPGGYTIRETPLLIVLDWSIMWKFRVAKYKALVSLLH